MTSLAEKLGRKGPSAPSNRQVRVKLTHLSLGSVAKVSLVLGIALGLVTIIAGIIGWNLLDSFGSLHQLDLFSADLLGTGKSTLVSSILSFKTVFGLSMVLAILDVIVCTIGGIILAILYNLSVRLTGGMFIGFNND